MAKNIVLLSDGTGNSAAKLFKTSVWRLYQALDLRDGHDQVAYYDDGVGTSTFRPLAVLGGALGIGLKRNVKQIYTFLCRTYEPGDRIYAFGFSRGAFTIRVLVGMIASQGVISGRSMHPEALRKAVDRAYKADRRDYKTKWRRARRAQTATQTDPSVPPGRLPATIEFLGVWDTVDAYGLPIDEMKRGLDYWLLGLSFPDQDLSPIVKRACHALALDDERRTFHPVLWNEAFEEVLIAKGKVARDRLKQVWFAGMHSNVGGGYAKDGLAYECLRWMAGEAADVGLKLHAQPVAEFDRLANVHEGMGDSRAGLSAYYRYDPRRLSVLCDDSYNKVTITRPKIHHSVFDRIRDHRVPYVPRVIPAAYDVVGPEGRVVANTYEDQAAALAREQDLERAWDLVWWRRVVYFITLAFTAALAWFPRQWPAPPSGAGCTGTFCVLEPVLVAVANVLPGFVQPWITAFRAHIDEFLVIAIGLGCALASGIWLDRRIGARASEAWGHLTGLSVGARRRWGPFSRVARSLRTNGALVHGYRWLARSALPFVFFVATVLALLIAGHRMLFEIGEAAGVTCRPTSGDVVRLTSGSVPVRAAFETSNPCFATGVRLQKGVTYDATFTVKRDDPWFDGGKATEPSGFASRKGGPIFFAGLPLRRAWLGDWFRPIARVGHWGRDRHVPPVAHDQKGAYVMRFTARTDGELFLFVNDAVIAVPGLSSRFYKNNRGSADVTITRIEGQGG